MTVNTHRLNKPTKRAIPKGMLRGGIVAAVGQVRSQQKSRAASKRSHESRRINQRRKKR